MTDELGAADASHACARSFFCVVFGQWMDKSNSELPSI